MHDVLGGSARGLKSKNGGIKIQAICLICQSVFRKSAKIRPQSSQEVSGHFGMSDTYRIACHAVPRARISQLALWIACGVSKLIGLIASANVFRILLT